MTRLMMKHQNIKSYNYQKLCIFLIEFVTCELPLFIAKQYLNMNYSLGLQYNKMLKQQISPWTIYDQNGIKVPQQQQKPVQKSPPKPYISDRLLKKNSQDKYTKMTSLLACISSQKQQLNQKINILTTLKSIRGCLFQQNNPINQIKMYLPKIKQQNQSIQPNNKYQHHRRAYHSQKLSMLHNLQSKALDDFSKIFVSASLQPAPSSQTVVAKPQFPKVKKNNSVLLPDLDGKKQFDDNTIHEVIQSAKRSNRKKGSIGSLLYDFS